MSVQTALKANEQTLAGELSHVTWCCDEDRSLCGLDISDVHWCYAGCGCIPCVVCDDLDYDDVPCPGCGE